MEILTSKQRQIGRTVVFINLLSNQIRMNGSATYYTNKPDDKLMERYKEMLLDLNGLDVTIEKMTESSRAADREHLFAGHYKITLNKP